MPACFGHRRRPPCSRQASSHPPTPPPLSLFDLFASSVRRRPRGCPARLCRLPPPSAQRDAPPSLLLLPSPSTTTEYGNAVRSSLQWSPPTKSAPAARRPDPPSRGFQQPTFAAPRRAATVPPPATAPPSRPPSAASHAWSSRCARRRAGLQHSGLRRRRAHARLHLLV